MRINKLLSIVLSLCMVITLMPTGVWAESDAQTHCICGAAHQAIGEHANEQSVQWQAISSPEDLMAINQDGNYYLTGDIKIGSSWKPVNGVNLCLNGCSIIETGIKQATIEVSENVTFTLTDCSGNGKITHERNTLTGRGVSVTEGGTFYMYGGSITGNSMADGQNGNGGGVHVYRGTFIMNGGSIRDNKAQWFSGGVHVSKSTFIMNGGEISSNTVETVSSSTGSSGYGGGVSVSGELSESGVKGLFTMNGGRISDNKVNSSSDSNGGGVFVNYKSIFTMNGGEISGNTTTGGGGGVFVDLGSFTMKNGSITNNQGSSGGGVFVNNSGTFTMDGGEISGSTANNGGGVYVNNTCTFEMKGGKISGNVAKNDNSESSNGGGVYVTGEFQMLDGKITGNTAGNTSVLGDYGYGGGVYVGYKIDVYGSFHMQGGEISGNEALRSGGGVFEEGTCSTFTMTGGRIIGNKADFYGGGGVYVGGKFTMSGGNIKGNSIVNYGGGVFVSDGGAMTVSGAVQITDNVKNGTWNTNTGMYEKGSDTYSNAYRENDKPITIGEDGLAGTARIGVTTVGTPTDTNPVEFAEKAAGDVNYSAIFIPDVTDQNYCVTKKGTTLYLRVHQHSWKYNLSKTNTNNDTITVTCSDGTCEDSGGRVTIEAPGDLTYNGRAKEARVTKTNGLGDDVDITYQVKKDEENWEPLAKDVKPTNAGTYTASITLGEGNDAVTASVEYTISKANPTCTAPSGLSATYGQQLSEIEITNPAGNTAGTWSWADKTQIVGNTGIKFFKATFTPDDKNNYNTMTDIDVSVTVSAKQIEPTVNVTGDMTYAGVQIKPTVTVTYNETTLIKDRDYTVSYGENINAGKGTVTITAKAGSNYSFDNINKEFNITPKEVSISGITVDDKVYNGGTNATISDNGILSGKIENDNLTYTVTGTFEGKNAGTDKTVNLTVTLTGDKAGNYRFAENSQKTAIADITAREIALTGGITAENRKYETNNREVILTKGTLSFDNLVDGEMLDINIPAKGTIETPDAGENKTVTYRGVTLADVENKGLAKNYKLSDQLPMIKVNITKADGRVTAPTGIDNLVYNGSPQTLINAGNSETGTIQYRLGTSGNYSTELPEATSAGEYVVYYKVVGDNNHNDIGEQSIKVITIAKATATITVKDKTAYIGEKTPDLSKPEADKDYTISGLFGDDKLTAVPTLTYEKTPDMNNKGEYTITARGASAGDNYTVEYVAGKLTVANRPAVLPAEDDVKTTTDDNKSQTTTSTTVKETKTETVKDESGNDVTRTTATVSDKVADKLVDQAVSNNSDTVEITVKSDDGNKADSEKQVELEIPKSAVKDIADKTDASLVINTDNGQVALDSKALKTIASETQGDTVRIVVNENAQLKESQEPAADVIKSGRLFDVSVYIGERRIHDLRGGKVEIRLPIPETLKDRDIAVVYISDKGICEIIDHTAIDGFAKITVSHLSNFAVTDKTEADSLIKQQNQGKAKELIKEAKLKATTSKTSKKNVKITVRAESSLIRELKDMGYTVKYKFYRSTKKASKYTAVKTKAGDTYINTKGKKGTRYYYKARVLVYEGKKLIAQTELKQCSYGMRVWSK